MHVRGRRQVEVYTYILAPGCDPDCHASYAPRPIADIVGKQARLLMAGEAPGRAAIFGLGFKARSLLGGRVPDAVGQTAQNPRLGSSPG
jgi:hypothetical protein